MEYNRNNLYYQAESMKQNIRMPADCNEPDCRTLSPKQMVPPAPFSQPQKSPEYIPPQKSPEYIPPQMKPPMGVVPENIEKLQIIEPEIAYAQPKQNEPCGYCVTLAMAYVPEQKWTQTYEAEVGFQRGTIFPELDLPFLGEGVRK